MALPCASRNVLAMPPPITMMSTLASRFLRTLILSETLAPPMIAANGRSGFSRSLPRLGELLLHQEPGIGRAELRDPHGRGVRTVRRPERVVDVDVAVGRELLGELRVVLLLLRVEAEVLQEQDLAVAEALDRVLRAHAEGVAGHRDRLAHELAEALGHRPEPEAVADLAVRPAEVAGQDDPGALGLQVPDRGQRRPDARVVGDPAILERDVEVDADEDALARGVEVPDGELVHLRFLREPWGSGSGQPIGDELHEVRDAAAVAPLVVVPGDDLDEVAAQDHVRREVDDRGPAVAAEVAGHERVVAGAEDPLERPGGGVTEGLVELLERDVLLELGGEVHHGDGGGRDAQAEAVELALEVRDHEGEGLGRRRSSSG